VLLHQLRAVLVAAAHRRPSLLGAVVDRVILKLHVDTSRAGDLAEMLD